jgi:ATP-binding cassette subfamily B protein
MRTIFRVFTYTRRYPWMAGITLACAVAATSMVVIFPSVTQKIIDEGIRGHKPELILPLTLLAAGSFFLQEILNYVRVVLNNTFEQKVICDLRSDLYSRIQQLPLAWFDQRSTGDIMTRVLEDVASVERVIIDGIEQGSVAILQIAVVLILMFRADARLAWFALFPLPFLVSGALLYTLTAKNRYRVQRQASSAMNALLHDNISGIRQLKAYAREKEEHRRFNQASRRLADASLVVMRTWAIYAPSMNFLNNFGLALVTGFGGLAVIRGELDLGRLVAYLILVRFLYEPIGRLHSLNQLLQAGRAAGERVFEILDSDPEPDSGRVDLQAEDVLGRIDYKEVEFSYQSDRPAVHDITFTAFPGQTVALVGPTGAGKSTLVSLLLRFYEIDRGRILVDGHSISEFKKGSLREVIGYVTQESFLFNGTIRENLLLGNADATEQEIAAAIRAANAQSFVEQLPDGLDTSVGERGVKLSGGEKQRISIARALLKDPPILVLDEATASVDTETERQIQEALSRLLAGRTSFVIAHRLSTVRHADLILVLESGHIVERGTHEELLLQDGKYAQLCRSGLFLETGETNGPETEELASAVSQGDAPKESLPFDP